MNKVNRTINVLKDHLLNGWLPVLGVSGKDSMCVAHCLIEAMRQLKDEGQSTPPAWFVTISTTVENPEIELFMQDVHAAIDDYAVDYGLDLNTRFISPPVSARPWVQYIGRGILFRNMENQSKSRQCTVDWKITPLKAFYRELKQRYQTSKLLSLSGSRDEESAIRAANLKKRGEDIAVVTETDIGFKLAPVKDWTLSDVWQLIDVIDKGSCESFAEPVSRDMIKHYRNSNGGTCDVLAGNSVMNRKACGSRWGCWTCGQVKEDTSLQNMIDTDPKRYGYMQGLVDLRNYMFNTVNDYVLCRSLVGKDIKEGGFIKVGFNDYSMAYRKDLLQYIITLDVLEEERAEAAGEPGPKFCNIGFTDLVAIQWHWAKTGGERHAFEAIKTWFDIREQGKRYKVPHSSYTKGERVNFSGYAYFDVQRMIDELQVTGLAMNEEESWIGGAYRITDKAGEKVDVIPYDEVNAYNFGSDGDAWEYIEDCRLYYEKGLMARHVNCPTVAIKDMLRRGVVKIKKGLIRSLHQQVKRAQAVNVIEHNGVSFENYVLGLSISPEAYSEILTKQAEQAEDAKRHHPQIDMFTQVA